MRTKFRQLQIIGYINFFLLCGYMILVCLAFVNSIRSGNFNWVLLLNIAFLVALFAHTLFTLNIYNKHYPDRELSVDQLRYEKIIRVFAWITLGFMYLGMLGLAVQLTLISTAYNIYFIAVLIAFFVLTILTTIQVIGSSRLVKAINRNYRQMLQDSFSDNTHLPYEQP